MSREEQIRKILIEKFQPIELIVVNESHTHNVPKGSETHFKVEMISELFEGVSRVARQQLVLAQLKADFSKGLHALSMRLKCPSEAEKDPKEFESPSCLRVDKKKN